MDKKTGRGVSAGGGQSSLGYLFGGSEDPKPTNGSTPHAEKSAPASQSSPSVDISKQVPAGIQVKGSETNNYHRADGQNTGNFLTALVMYISDQRMQNRPSTKVHSAPGGGSSLGYLFGGGGN